MATHGTITRPVKPQEGTYATRAGAPFENHNTRKVGKMSSPIRRASPPRRSADADLVMDTQRDWAQQEVARGHPNRLTLAAHGAYLSQRQIDGDLAVLETTEFNEEIEGDFNFNISITATDSAQDIERTTALELT